MTARDLTGVALVTSDAHAGLVAAIGATLPGAGWQRCRTHYAANLVAATPKASWPWVKAMLHGVYDQPDAASVHAQFDPLGLDVFARCRLRPDTDTGEEVTETNGIPALSAEPDTKITR